MSDNNGTEANKSFSLGGKFMGREVKRQYFFNGIIDDRKVQFLD
jgi:hypothetical protein